MARAYSSPGRYRTGVWLVTKGGQGAIVTKANLPPQGTGFDYYWLGSNVSEATSRIYDAAPKVGYDPTGVNFPTYVHKAFNRGTAQLPGQRGGILGAIQKAIQGGVFLPPAGTAGSAGEAGGAGAAEGGAAGGGVGGAAAGGAAAGVAGSGLFGTIASAITSSLAFMAFIAWIFHPRTLLRMVEFLTGIVLMIFGFWAAMQARGERSEGYATSETALSRSGLGRVARALARPNRRRVTGAPHRERREALRQRYHREAQLRRRQREQV